jgi:hypothetical protein
MRSPAANMSRCEQSVYEALRELGPSTDQDVKVILGWEICQVTARRNDLVTRGLVAHAGHTSNPAGRKVKTWQVVAQ